MRKVKNNRELILYPNFNKRDDLVEICTKLSWYVPKRNNISLFFKTKIILKKEFYVSKNEIPPWMNRVKPNLKNIFFINQDFFGNLEYYFKFLKSLLCKFFLKNNDVIIVIWDTKKISLIFKLIKKFFIVRVIDNKIGSYKSDINLFLIGDQSKMEDSLLRIKKSKDFFKDFSEKLIKKYKKTYIFTRGKSINLCFDMQINDGIRVVCNSVLASQKLIEHIKPHFIVAVDHSWYFGCSNLSQVFLQDVFNCIKNFNSFFIVPSDIKWLLDIYYPKLKNNIIGIPYCAKNYNLDFLKKFSVFGSVGVLHEILIPLGSTLSDEIIIFGADGKYQGKDNKKSFSFIYKYSQEATYSQELVDDFLASRPNYYDIANKENFEKNFDFHLKNIINIIKIKGKKIIIASKSSHESFRDLPILNKEN